MSDGDDADRRPARMSTPGPGSVLIGANNYGSVTTNVTQHITQFLLFGRRARATVEDTVDRLAWMVKHQWTREVKNLGLNSGSRLPVSWNPVEGRLCGAVADARTWVREHDPPAVAARGDQWVEDDAELAGANLDLASVWLRRTPTRRLVVLGEPGSGKTELMIRTLVEVLGRRDEFGGIVPILVPAAAWDGAPYPHRADPAESATDSIELWLERWLVRTYRFLGQLAPRGGSYAMALLRANRIAIIIDGFDEVPEGAREDLLRYLRDDVFDNPQRIVLLTSRPVEYTRSALDHSVEVLGAAVGVRLVPQSSDDIIEHLRRGSPRRDRWDTVAAAVHSGGVLASVLDTPIMVLLADAVYNADKDPPAPDRLTTMIDAKEVQQHLIDRYVEARFRGESRWHLDDVTTWLRFLATTLKDRTNPTDLTWWDLRPARLGGRTWTFVLVPTVAVLWTLASAATFNGWIFQDLELGVVAAARVAAATVISYAAVVALTRNLGAGILAVTGAYIAGTISASYDLAVVAAIAGGFGWRPLTTSRLRWWHLALFAATVASAGTVLQDDTPSTGSVTGMPWTMGFGAGFADGWASRGDEVVNGWALSALTAGTLLWAAVQVTPLHCAERGTADRAPARRRWPRWAVPVAAAAATAVLGGLTNGVRDDVTNGWLTGPADGWAAGIATGCAAAWIGTRSAGRSTAHQDTGRRLRAVRRAWGVAAAAGLVTVTVSGVAYTARTDMDHPWCRAMADGAVVAVVVWFVRHPDRVTFAPQRGRGMLRGWMYAVAAATVVGFLDSVSAGWGRATITGLGAGLLVAYTQHVLHRREEPAGRRGGLLDSPLHAGAFVAAVTGVAAGAAYGLMLGVVFGLAVQVSRDVSQRRFPSRTPSLTPLGTAGGMILGVVIAGAAGFSGVPPIWLFPIGLTSGFAAAVAFGARGHGVTENEVLSPGQVLIRDRRTFLIAVGVIAAGLGLAAGIRTVAQGGGWYVGAIAVLTTTATYGLTAGLLIAAAQARYGGYLMWRVIYAVRGLLPWRLMTFLSVAHQRGILRRNGAVYQFRHQFLQERLTDYERP